MTSTLTSTDRYQAAYQERIAVGDQFSALREKAYRRFESVGFPVARKGNERWKYTNIAPIARAEYQISITADSSPTIDEIRSQLPFGDTWQTIAFVDGIFSEGLSTVGDGRPGVSIERLSATDSPLTSELGSIAQVDEDDGFGALNTAVFADGAVILLNGEIDAESPVHVLFVTTERSQPTMTSPRVLVIAEKFSKAVLIESHIGLESGVQFSNAVTEVAVGEGASLSHYRILEKGHESFHIGTTRVRQEKDSSYTSVSFAFGARIGRDDLHVLLDGPGSECTLNGLYMTSASDHLDNHISLTHAKPHATSKQLYKGILTGKSKAVFSGQVLVEKDAQKTYAVQRDMNLLLSDGAEVDTKPSLLIYADDVQCFHGAAAGEVDEDAIFYMLSRGLDRETASRILITAYADEIINHVETESLRAHLRKSVDKLLPVFHF
ncbi:MAG: Fe-S cluster assembly protein SufD [Chloroflexi bacterium]|nr:Fe-S cluster assembly protein SufD [Chloroflexota bacterium]